MIGCIRQALGAVVVVGVSGGGVWGVGGCGWSQGLADRLVYVVPLGRPRATALGERASRGGVRGPVSPVSRSQVPRQLAHKRPTAGRGFRLLAPLR
jgi:hypothetical protein